MDASSKRKRKSKGDKEATQKEARELGILGVQLPSLEKQAMFLFGTRCGNETTATRST